MYDTILIMCVCGVYVCRTTALVIWMLRWLLFRLMFASGIILLYTYIHIIHTHIHTHTYIYTHIHTYIHSFRVQHAYFASTYFNTNSNNNILIIIIIIKIIITNDNVICVSYFSGVVKLMGHSPT